MNKFKVGDIIKGIDTYKYMWTDTAMTRAEVIELKRDNKMRIKILKHENAFAIGDEYNVENSEKYFELIECKKVSKEDLFKMPIGTIITTDATEDNKYVYDGDSFSSEKYCIYNYEIEDELTLDDKDYGTKIIKIEKPTEYETIYEFRAETKEMTIAEIEKELGHPVKVIKEEED